MVRIKRNTRTLGKTPNGIQDVTRLLKSLTQKKEAIRNVPKPVPVYYPSWFSEDMQDHVIEKNDVIVPHGGVGKFEANIEAIILAKGLKEQGIFPDKEQKKTLAKFVGWGGLANMLYKDRATFSFEKEAKAFFSNTRQRSYIHYSIEYEPYSFVGKSYKDCYSDLEASFKSNYPNANNLDMPTFRRLVALGIMTDEEFDNAESSAINAHYTDRYIIDKMWELIREFGFEGGSVLESSAGIGHFFGLMPQDLRQNSNLFAVEKDALTGSMLQLLYPNAVVQVKGFEEADNLPFGKFDLAIGNVPFGGKKLAVDKTFQEISQFNLHNYFIAKNLICLRPGGIAVLITSMSTLDNGTQKDGENTVRITSRDFREWATQADKGNSDLIGAIRLPNTAFSGNAKTEVTTDILVFRKRIEKVETNLAQPFLNVYSIDKRAYKPEARDYDPKTDNLKPNTPITIDLNVNEYYIKNPAQMVGEMFLAHEVSKGGLYSANEATCHLENTADYKKLLDKAFDNLAVSLKDCYTHIIQEITLNNVIEPLGSYVIKDGKGYMVDVGDEGYGLDYTELQFDKKFTLEMLRGYIDVKSALRKLIEVESASDANDMNTKERKELNAKYDAFVGKFGEINALKKYFDEEVDWYMISSLEDLNVETDKYEKAEIFTKKTITLEEYPTTAKDLPEAVLISESYLGKIDLPYIATLLSTTVDIVEKELLTKEFEIQVGEKVVLRPLAFINPSNFIMEVHEAYLSGNIREKLRFAQKVAENNPDFNINVRHLEANQPQWLTLDKIKFNLGSTWLPLEVVEQFALFFLELDVKVNRYSTGDSLKYDVEVKSGKYDKKDKHNAKNISAGIYITPGTRKSEYTLPNGKKIQVVQPDIDTKLGHHVLELVLSQAIPEIQRYQVDDNGNVRFYTNTKGDKAYLKETDDAMTSLLNDKMTAMNLAFIRFVSQDTKLIERLENVYNETFNNYVPRVWTEPIFEYFPGASKDKKLRSYQKSAVKRALIESTGIFHGVGTGKSITLQTIAMEGRRLGLAKKPMIVVQNATYKQFLTSFYKQYPKAKILGFGKMPLENLKKEKEVEGLGSLTHTSNLITYEGIFGLDDDDTLGNTDMKLKKAKATRKERLKLFGRIATGNYDAIIVPQSVFSMIPDSILRLKALYLEQKQALEAVMENVKDMKDKADDSYVKKLEAVKRGFEKKLQDLDKELELDEVFDEDDEGGKKNTKKAGKKNLTEYAKLQAKALRKVDSIADFENLGIDMLLIDEFHAYKRFGFSTNKENVKGIDTAGSERSLSTMLKIRYIFEKMGGERNVVGATGTPISNTMAEMWTMAKYLRPAILRNTGSESFDAFCNNFALVVNSFEMDAGGRYKTVARLAKYQNMPELLKIWFAFADVVLRDVLGKPKNKEGVEMTDEEYIANHKNNYNNQTPLLAMQPHGKRDFTSIVIPQSKEQAKQVRIFRQILFHFDRMDFADKKQYSFIPLLVYGLANRATTDLRLLPPYLSKKSDFKEPIYRMNQVHDVGNSKIDYCVKNALDIYFKGDAEGENVLQMIFCDRFRLVVDDLSQTDKNGNPKQVEVFNAYKEIKRLLIEGGVPANEIVIITEVSKSNLEDVFDKAKTGEIAFLIGSTEKMGVGVNVQDRLLALHHIDAPVRPMDFEQRNGRIQRQGNRNPVVQIFTYGVAKTLDAVSYDRLKTKQTFISQIMLGDVSKRDIEDEIDDEQGGFFEALSTMLTGSSTALDLMNARKELKQVQVRIDNANSTYLSNQQTISNNQKLIENYGEKLKVAEIFDKKVKADNLKRGNEKFTIDEIVYEGKVIWNSNSTKTIEVEKEVTDKETKQKRKEIVEKQEKVPTTEAIQFLLDELKNKGKDKAYTSTNNLTDLEFYVNGFLVKFEADVIILNDKNQSVGFSRFETYVFSDNGKGGTENLPMYFRDALKFGNDVDITPSGLQGKLHRYFRASDEIVDFYKSTKKQKENEVEFLSEELKNNDISKLSSQLGPLNRKIQELQDKLTQETKDADDLLNGLNGITGGITEAQFKQFAGIRAVMGLGNVVNEEYVDDNNTTYLEDLADLQEGDELITPIDLSKGTIPAGTVVKMYSKNAETFPSRKPAIQVRCCDGLYVKGIFTIPLSAFPTREGSDSQTDNAQKALTQLAYVLGKMRKKNQS